MRRYILFAIVITIAQFLCIHPVFAAFSPLSIRMEKPKTPTNQNTFDVTFVTLDAAQLPVTVTCWKLGPGDGSFIQFGSAQTFTNGGNTGTCPVTSSIFTTKGDYIIKTVANDGTNEVSDSATVTYNNEGPGDPTGYGKSRVNTCDYKIHFHSADDAGKTVKIEVYRSENTSFTADAGSRVDTVVIGSNTDGSSITTPPNCNKEYYFGIRAFDSAGNGSNIVGDSVINVTTTNTTTTTTTTTGGGTGAILITPGTGGAVLGEETASGAGKVLGETAPETVNMNATQNLLDAVRKHGILIIGLLLFIVGAIGLYVSSKKQTGK